MEPKLRPNPARCLDFRSRPRSWATGGRRKSLSLLLLPLSQLCAPPCTMDPAHRGSLPDVEFLRNLNSTRNMSFSQNPRWRRHASLDAGVGRFRSRLSSTYEGEGDSPTSSSFGAEEEKQRLLSDFPGPSSPWSSPTGFSFERKRSPMKMVLVGVVLIFVGAVFGIVALSQDGAEDWWGVKTKLEDYGVKFKHGE